MPVTYQFEDEAPNKGVTYQFEDAPKAPSPGTKKLTAATGGGGFLNDVLESLKKRGSSAYQEMTLPVRSNVLMEGPEKLLRIAGEAGGAMTDIATAGGKSLYKNLVPDVVQKAISRGGNYLANTDIGKAQLETLSDVNKGLGYLKNRFPESAKNVEAGLNIAGGLGVAKLGKELLPIGKEAVNVGRDLAAVAGRKTAVDLEKALDVTAQKGIEKTILTTRGKSSLPDVQRFLDKGKASIIDIAENKDNLSFINPEGAAIKGELPTTLSEWKQAVYQREGELFKQYDAMDKAAGGKGAVVTLDPLADKLETWAKSKVIMTENPQAASYALKKAEAYRNAGSYTAEEAQQALIELNSKFEAYLKNPTPEKAVDVISGNNIREALYKAVMEKEGPGYENLRRTFGAHKEIEADVTKRAIREVAKSGGPGWLDILSGSEFTAGLLSANPALMARGGMLEGLNIVRKYWRDPNRIVKGMFSDTKDLLEKRAALGLSPEEYLKSKMIKNAQATMTAMTNVTKGGEIPPSMDAPLKYPPVKSSAIRMPRDISRMNELDRMIANKAERSPRQGSPIIIKDKPPVEGIRPSIDYDRIILPAIEKAFKGKLPTWTEDRLQYLKTVSPASWTADDQLMIRRLTAQMHGEPVKRTTNRLIEGGE